MCLYQEAWRDSVNSKRFLSEALSVAQEAYEGGSRQHLLINNYIALLLDSQQYEEALSLLQDINQRTQSFVKIM